MADSSAAPAAENPAKIGGMSDKDVKDENINKAFDAATSGLEKLDEGVNNYGDAFVEKCGSVFGEKGKAFGSGLKTMCKQMIAGCTLLLPRCKDEANKMSAESASSRDFNAANAAVTVPAPPTCPRPAPKFVTGRRAETGYTA